MEKTLAHCSSPSCMEFGTFQPHDNYLNVTFCERHARQLLVVTVNSIADGTHPGLQELENEVNDENYN